VGRDVNIDRVVGLAVLWPAFDGIDRVRLGEGPGYLAEGVDFRVSSRGTYVSSTLAAPFGAVARCVSLTLSHLSLSLSLLPLAFSR
jgi:hypothetical protein